MGRAIGACLAGLIGWAILATVLNLPLRSLLDGYAAAEKSLDFTLLMQFARLLIGALASIGAGWVAARVAAAGSRVPILAGGIVLAAMIPVHAQLWAKFPLWYHAFFLLTIVPFFWLGARTGRRSASPAAG
ncbi:MAG: hypothetical protein R3E77_14130 [Steroidobacteraceae bacterium]